MLIDDDDFVVFYHVIAITLEQDVRLESGLDVMIGLEVHRVEHVAKPQQLLDLEHAFFGESDGLVLFIDRVIAGGPFLSRLLAFDHLAAGEEGNDAVDLVVLVGGLFAGTGDDQQIGRASCRERVLMPV